MSNKKGAAVPFSVLSASGEAKSVSLGGLRSYALERRLGFFR